MNTIITKVRSLLRQNELIEFAIRAELRALTEEMRLKTPDNPALKGFKAYSQFDEDGVIEDIFKRIGGGSTFTEIGCGNGLENNTHYLLLKGWTGTWVDADTKNIDLINGSLPKSPKLNVVQAFVDAGNASSLAGNPDFLSIDMGGNELHVWKSIKARPKVLCVEYNGKFPPPTVLNIAYRKDNVWRNNDYHGASLQAWANELTDYTLVACNLSGANAFFVRNDLMGAFTRYPIEDLFQPLRLHIIPMRGMHPASFSFLRDTLSQGGSSNVVPPMLARPAGAARAG